MARHFLLYWLPETVEYHLASNFLLKNAGSNQLSGVATGDTLWIVTTGEADDLCLVGRLRVAKVVTLEEARHQLSTTDLWQSSYHALAAPDTAEPMLSVSLSDEAHLLRFVDASSARLTLTSYGGVNPEQLCRMRELDIRCSSLLAAAFKRAKARMR